MRFFHTEAAMAAPLFDELIVGYDNSGTDSSLGGFAMTINKTLEDGNIIISLAGKLNTGAADEFQDILISAFEEAGSGSIILDFEKLSYISSAGLRALFIGEKKAREKKGCMKIVNISSEIKETLHMTGFSEILKIE
jgi:anti-anti-sigma factor